MLFKTAIAQMVVPVIVLAASMRRSPISSGTSGIMGVFILNAFFAALFIGSALLFQRAAREQHPASAGAGFDASASSEIAALFAKVR